MKSASDKCSGINLRTAIAPAMLGHLQTGQHVRTFTGHHDTVRPVCLSTDGTRLLTGCFDHSAKLWNVQSGQDLVTFSGGHFDWIRAACLSSDNSFAVIASKDRTVCFWDVDSGQLLARLLNLRQGLLWTTPPDEHADNGRIWTDREDLVDIQTREK